MKKANGAGKQRTATMAQVLTRRATRKRRDEVAKLSALRDAQIDTSDIPEIQDTTGWMRNPLYRPVTQSITIRINAPDIAAARALSKSKGVPYQTYVRQLLHSALERELLAARR